MNYGTVEAMDLVALLSPTVDPLQRSPVGAKKINVKTNTILQYQLPRHRVTSKIE